MKNESLILAIDTSCDDTAVAVCQGYNILANIVASQNQIHQAYGGVFPSLAKLAHKENIEPCLQMALKTAHRSYQDIQAIAVTVGPGLAPSLEVGISKAKEIALKYHKQLIAVNHLEGHALSALAKRKNSYQDDRSQLTFPILAIIISGGHSEFIKIKNLGIYEKLGYTIDDAAGEALDKVGRMLNLGYPAGPVIEKLAKLGDLKNFSFPLPMTEKKDFNLSFSGLKTSARNLIEKLEQNQELKKQTIYNLAASFQEIVFKHICYKLEKILQQEKFKLVLLGGGVAANICLRKKIRQSIKKYQLKLAVPYSKKLCSDNAAMIAIAASHKFTQHEFVINIPKLERLPRFTIESI